MEARVGNEGVCRRSWAAHGRAILCPLSHTVPIRKHHGKTGMSVELTMLAVSDFAGIEGVVESARPLFPTGHPARRLLAAAASIHPPAFGRRRSAGYSGGLRP